MDRPALDVYTSTDLLAVEILLDNTAVLVSEGTEILCVDYAAPTDDTGIVLHFNGFGSHEVTDNALVAALFVDDDLCARRVNAVNPAGWGYGVSFSLDYVHVPGDTLTHRYKIRAGSTGGAMRLNAWPGNPPLSFLGAVAATLSAQAGPEFTEAIGQWRIVTPEAPWEGRDGAGLLSYDGDLYMLGGWNPFRTPVTNNEFWRSTNNGKNWELVSYAPWQGRHTVGWGVFNNKIVVVGGDANSGNYQKDIWTYDKVNGWVLVTASAPWATPGRVLFQTVFLDDRVLVIGGQTLDELVVPGQKANLANPFYSDVWQSFDLVNWTKVSDNNAFAPRSSIIGQVVLDGRVYLIGGGQYDTAGRPRLYFNSIYSAPLTDLSDWRLEPAPPWSGRLYANVFVYKGEVWMFGGANAAGNIQEVWRWKPGQAWRKCSAPWSARHAASAVEHKGEVYFLGGPLSDRAVWAMN